MRFPAWGPGRLAFAGFTHFYAPGAKLKISLETAAMKCGETKPFECESRTRKPGYRKESNNKEGTALCGWMKRQRVTP